MLKTTPVKAFSDNYIWLIHGQDDASRVAVVDPGDAAPVSRTLERDGLTLTAILITHHHPDHVGGVRRLLERRDVPVYGPVREHIPAITHKLSEGDRVILEDLGLEFEVLEVPGHTAGHIAYVGHGALFCGDTLFCGGCGRLFEGTAAQMTASLEKFRRLPPDTRVYCAHEYTLSNLHFARAVEPGNQALAEFFAAAQAMRERDEATVPSTIGLELEINPFLRCHLPDLQRSAVHHTGQDLDDEVAVFAAIRRWKDTF